jgi:TonB-dependent SusC/RagA subfamily outer membrane receptor
MKRRIIFLMILMLLLSCNLFAQKQGKKYYITGQVIDINDKPVSGAIVLIDNHNTEVVTDAKGMYKVRVKTDATKIAVLRPNIELKDEEINGRTVINFRLTRETSLQTKENQEKPDNEKINIGYGYVSKKDLTTTVGKIEGQNKKYVNYQNIYQMLQEDPSVQIDGTKITIRGASSVTFTDPLLIVDGMVVSSIDNIRPNMVKSIEILKGSGASIYGSRGANGVVLITLIGNQ